MRGRLALTGLAVVVAAAGVASFVYRESGRSSTSVETDAVTSQDESNERGRVFEVPFGAAVIELGVPTGYEPTFLTVLSGNGEQVEIPYGVRASGSGFAPSRSVPEQGSGRPGSVSVDLIDEEIARMYRPDVIAGRTPNQPSHEAEATTVLSLALVSGSEHDLETDPNVQLVDDGDSLQVFRASPPDGDDIRNDIFGAALFDDVVVWVATSDLRHSTKSPPDQDLIALLRSLVALHR